MAPFEQHWLHIGDQPHLYPLARLESQYPRYAAVLADTHTRAHHGLRLRRPRRRTRRRRASRRAARRRADGRRRATSATSSNFHLQHVKEVVDTLDRIVQAEGITQILLSGDEVIMPLLREQMPKHLADKVVDQVRLPTHAPAHDVMRASLDAMAKLNERTDKEKVDAAIGAYRAGGLGVVGPEDTLMALTADRSTSCCISAYLARYPRRRRCGQRHARSRNPRSKRCRRRSRGSRAAGRAARRRAHHQGEADRGARHVHRRPVAARRNTAASRRSCGSESEPRGHGFMRAGPVAFPRPRRHRTPSALPSPSWCCGKPPLPRPGCRSPPARSSRRR